MDAWMREWMNPGSISSSEPSRIPLFLALELEFNVLMSVCESTQPQKIRRTLEAEGR